MTVATSQMPYSPGKLEILQNKHPRNVTKSLRMPSGSAVAMLGILFLKQCFGFSTATLN